jgi:hypothetical protein
VLVEASPIESVRGIGLAADDPRAEDPEQWRGLNLLGFALADARRGLLQKCTLIPLTARPLSDVRPEHASLVQTSVCRMFTSPTESSTTTTIGGDPQQSGRPDYRAKREGWLGEVEGLQAS